MRALGCYVDNTLLNVGKEDRSGLGERAVINTIQVGEKTLRWREMLLRQKSGENVF